MAKRQNNSTLTAAVTAARSILKSFDAQVEAGETAVKTATAQLASLMDGAAKAVAAVRQALSDADGKPSIVGTVRAIYPDFPDEAAWTKIRKAETADLTETDRKHSANHARVRRLLLRFDGMGRDKDGEKAVTANLPQSIVLRLLQTLRLHHEGLYSQVIGEYSNSLPSEDRDVKVEALKAKVKTAKSIGLTPKASKGTTAKVKTTAVNVAAA